MWHSVVITVSIAVTVEFANLLEHTSGEILLENRVRANEVLKGAIEGASDNVDRVSDGKKFRQIRRVVGGWR